MMSAYQTFRHTTTPEYLAESRTVAIQTVMALVIALPAIVVCLRCYARSRQNKSPAILGLDDAIIVIATIVLIADAGVILAATGQGLGRHIEYIVATLDQGVHNVSIMTQLAQSLVIIACTLSKTAFAVTLLRIFVQRWATALLIFIIVSMNLANILCAIFVFVQCRDPRALWDPEVPSQCWGDSFTDYSLFVGYYSAAQDFILAILPCVIILRLNMDRMEKIGIAFSMSLGIFAGVAGIVKSIYLVDINNKEDRYYVLASLLMWAAAEDALAIIAATIPTLYPLVRSSSPMGPASYELSDDIYPVSRGRNTDKNLENGSSGRRNSYDDNSGGEILPRRGADGVGRGKRRSWQALGQTSTIYLYDWKYET